ncbi:MBL fold metallo-hydrolase [Nocardia yunnanensis]|nr:MBL fold metallo-hydrolase [Nocardia yunnanensis]
MRHLIRPAFDPAETAVRQIERLGFTREDVRHIIVTHLDMDHIGGIADFPHAKIHTTAAEMLAAVVNPGRRERARYRRVQWAHGAQFVEHGPGGESWRGFPAAQELTAIAPGLVLIPTPGHTRGHACVAVDSGLRWLLHCGDAFYHWGAIDGRAAIPWSVKAMEALATYDREKLLENRQRIAELHRGDDHGLRIVSAHDPADLAACVTPT